MNFVLRIYNFILGKSLYRYRRLYVDDFRHLVEYVIGTNESLEVLKTRGAELDWKINFSNNKLLRLGEDEERVFGRVDSSTFLHCSGNLDHRLFFLHS